ncbi:MAG: hypothetical protein K2L51_07065 [Clostridiales bacterium]|nr:hypothetical protein [Clostridiales bacterium]
MKKIRNALISAALLVCLAFSLTACYEGGPDKGGAMATAIALGHGDCITEVTVAIDGYGNPTKVVFDDIFPVKNVYSNVYDAETKTGIGQGAETFTITKTVNEKPQETKYFRYLHIGNKYFEGSEVNGAPVYTEMNAENGIIDLEAYCKTDAGVQWYYDSFMSGVMEVCKIDDAAGTQVGSVKLGKASVFNTSNGSMRKRYSRYWSALGGGSLGQVAGLGFNGNMDALETYLLAYGFDALDNMDTAIVKDGSYNAIGGITTGATLGGDIKIYLKVAKEAYEKALALQK